MKRILYTTVFLGLLIVLAVGAVYALNGPATVKTASVAAPAADTAPLALAPTATQNYNFIALPLDSSDSFSYTAPGLASYVGSSVKQVVKWDASSQSYVSYTPGGPGGFNLEIGGSYFLLVDSSSPTVLSFVGDVPAQGSVSFALDNTATSGCRYTSLSVPLDQSGINDANDLANAIGSGVQQVIKWDAGSQSYVSYTAGGPGAFPVSIGYPYFVCLDSSAPANWP